MKNAFLFLFLFMFLFFISCGSSKADKICNCYKIFVDEIVKENVDLNSATVRSDLISVFEGLKKNNETFKSCLSDVPGGHQFKSSQMTVFCAMRDDCVDCDLLMKIAESGPMVYGLGF